MAALADKAMAIPFDLAPPGVMKAETSLQLVPEFHTPTI